MLSAALRACYQPGGVPVTLVIEEGYVLGHHAEIEAALSILRGFNSRMTIVFQSLAQIKQLYPAHMGFVRQRRGAEFPPRRSRNRRLALKTIWRGNKSGAVGVRSVRPLRISGSRPSWSQQKRPRIPVAALFFDADMPVLSSGCRAT